MPYEEDDGEPDRRGEVGDAAVVALRHEFGLIGGADPGDGFDWAAELLSE